MGLFGEIFHPHHDEADQQKAGPEQAAGTHMETGDAVAAAAETGQPTDSVESADVASEHMDMAPAGPATVDLSAMPVHPAEKSENESSSESSDDRPDLHAEETPSIDEATDTTETTVPVNAGEFSTAVPPADVKDELPVITGGEGKEEAAGESEHATAEATDNQEADDSGAADAEAMLENWQHEAIGGAKDAGGEAEIPDSPATTETTATADAASVEGSASEQKDDFAAKLEAEAADEAADIEARMQGEKPEDARPEIKTVASEITPEATGVETEEQAPEQEPEAAAVEDAPFPAPPVEAETAEAPEVSAETNEADNSEVVGGGDVHLDRAEYVMPDPAAETSEVTLGAEQGEVVDLAKIRENISKARTALDELEASLDKAA